MFVGLLVLLLSHDTVRVCRFDSIAVISAHCVCRFDNIAVISSHSLCL